ncbi:hypothetical protein H0H93_002964 [Arthromyces matolae]|nr:hypothetical protein H0H93_002964 [Arthromyces matolae]
MQSTYGNYPYYAQQQYQQQPAYNSYPIPGPSNHYPSYNYPPYAPHQEKEPPFIPPPPPGFQQHTPRPKAHRRSATTSAAQPLKSAMKKSTSVPPPTDGLSRQATYPAAYPNHATRQRLLSNNHGQYTTTHNPDDFRPLHMFVSFIGNNELRIENLMEPGLQELRATILPMWPPGIELDAQRGHDWTVKFRNNPWTLQGPNVPKAWAIIVQLFTLFARRFDVHSQVPRLVFEVTSEDRTSHFFLAYLERGGRRLTLVKPPPSVDETLGTQLKAVLPRKVHEEPLGDDLRILDVRAPEVEPQFFLMHVLKVLAELNFNLATSLPLGRKGPLGLRTGRELLVFRGSIDFKN